MDVGEGQKQTRSEGGSHSGSESGFHKAGVEKIPVFKKTGIWYECKQVMVVVVVVVVAK
jgi:hypothetical protein